MMTMQCESMGAVEKKLKEMEIHYVRSMVEEGGIKVDQLFFHDPDGFMIEICNCDSLPVIPIGDHMVRSCSHVNRIQQQPQQNIQIVPQLWESSLLELFLRYSCNIARHIMLQKMLIKKHNASKEKKNNKCHYLIMTHCLAWFFWDTCLGPTWTDFCFWRYYVTLQLMYPRIFPTKICNCFWWKTCNDLCLETERACRFFLGFYVLELFFFFAQDMY